MLYVYDSLLFISQVAMVGKGEGRGRRRESLEDDMFVGESTYMYM